MTKSSITRDELNEVIATYGKHHIAHRMAIVLLAEMDSEPAVPVAEIVSIYGDPEAFGEREIRPLVGIQQMPYGTKLYRHAQPASVVPKSISVRQAISALESAGAVTTIGQAYKMGWNACRAAMLAASPQSPGSEPATVPGKCIPVSERMPEREVDVQVCCPDKKEQMVAYLERNELEGYFRFATWRTADGIYCQPSHWMSLPAAPQEGK
ncbi:DUF551 domain-containing protein [Klebsiella quasipneumoniae]|uniref:DUF551 domain-containing protein n=1 Tax=Klebsiella quasipneumoniae TaxID=1463165 RepID=UPI0031E2E1E1|nr:DUF551 domain-containing protein [Klebsiella quasipneumoniae subsp. similipneumoniae]